MVNKANVLKVADAIEKGTLVKRGIGFNMADFVRPPSSYIRDHIDSCGTVCCIAGHAYAIEHPRTKMKNVAREDIAPVATKYLDLDHDQALDLFFQNSVCGGDVHYLRDIRPATAVAVLRHLAETGIVDWSIPVTSKPEGA